ncbi:MAG: NAD(P)H-hydrate dehydratase [Christensenellaceae bacterium]
MKKVTSVAEIYALDAALIKSKKIPSLLLMEQAAQALANKVMALFSPPSHVLCIGGSGNNAGDVFAAARILRMHGYKVSVAITSLAQPKDAAANLAYFLQRNEVISLQNEADVTALFASSYDVILDGLFGVGLNRAVTGLYASIITSINAHPAFVVSADVPSGVFADTGAAPLAVKADETVTFSYAKPGHFLFPGRDHTGKLNVSPIAPTQDSEIATDMYYVDEFSMPKRQINTHKGTYGALAIIAGAKGMSGAALFTCDAAVHSGAGITKLYAASYVCDIVQQKLPAVLAKDVSKYDTYITIAEDKMPSLIEEINVANAFVLGPGLGTNEESIGFVKALAALNMPKIIDADGLNFLAMADVYAFGKNTILTPHPKEFARLSGRSVAEILENPLQHARAFAKKHHIVLLLKGSTTIVTDGVEVYFITAGTPAMAKGGSGDVLSGVIGGLLAQGFDPLVAAYAGAYLAGSAAEIAATKTGEYAFTPGDTIAHLKNVMR